jgi:hypothetical protein
LNRVKKVFKKHSVKINTFLSPHLIINIINKNN